MPYECFIEKNFRSKARAIINKANEIIAVYQAQGYKLTLRQLYYQFVARDLFANEERNYKLLGNTISDARLAGLIDWSAIEDRGRILQSNPHWDSPQDIIHSCAQQFRHDLWEDQPQKIEVWVEKMAAVGIIDKVCRKWDVPYFGCIGYVGQSAMWRAGVRAREIPTIILHFGDHDPSGMDMTRDNDDRMSMFSLGNVTVKRLALNMDQINEYDPPPNPTKVTDSRAPGYIAEYGHESWELDALEPKVINELIEEHIQANLIDPDLLERQKIRQQNARDQIGDVAANWRGLMSNWTEIESLIND